MRGGDRCAHDIDLGGDEIFTAGFTDAMLIIAVIALCAALIAFVGLRGRHRGAVPQAG
jgi:hypothetical protein